MTNPLRIVIIDYTDWRGERATWRVVPQSISFSNDDRHPDTQWMLEATDADGRGFVMFALKNIHSWKAWEEV